LTPACNQAAHGSQQPDPTRDPTHDGIMAPDTTTFYSDDRGITELKLVS
jgi:hypothetical protein